MTPETTELRDRLADAMGEWHGCRDNGRGALLPPCANCTARAVVCAAEVLAWVDE